MTKLTESHNESHSEVHDGDAQDLLKARNAQIKDLRKRIDKELDKWQGTPLTLVFTTADEDVERTGVQALTVGLGRVPEWMGLAQTLVKSADTITKEEMEDIRKAGGQSSSSNGIGDLLDMLAHLSGSDKKK